MITLSISDKKLYYFMTDCYIPCKPRVKFKYLCIACYKSFQINMISYLDNNPYCWYHPNLLQKYYKNRIDLL